MSSIFNNMLDNKMNKLLVNLVCLFIPRKKNKRHFRDKYRKLVNTSSANNIFSPLEQRNAIISDNTGFVIRGGWDRELYYDATR